MDKLLGDNPSQEFISKGLNKEGQMPFQISFTPTISKPKKLVVNDLNLTKYKMRCQSTLSYAEVVENENKQKQDSKKKEMHDIKASGFKADQRLNEIVKTIDIHLSSNMDITTSKTIEEISRDQIQRAHSTSPMSNSNTIHPKMSKTKQSDFLCKIDICEKGIKRKYEHMQHQDLSLQSKLKQLSKQKQEHNLHLQQQQQTQRITDLQNKLDQNMIQLYTNKNKSSLKYYKNQNSAIEKILKSPFSNNNKNKSPQTKSKDPSFLLLPLIGPNTNTENQNNCLQKGFIPYHKIEARTKLNTDINLDLIDSNNLADQITQPKWTEIKALSKWKELEGARRTQECTTLQKQQNMMHELEKLHEQKRIISGKENILKERTYFDDGGGGQKKLIEDSNSQVQKWAEGGSLEFSKQELQNQKIEQYKQFQKQCEIQKQRLKYQKNKYLLSSPLGREQPLSHNSFTNPKLGVFPSWHNSIIPRKITPKRIRSKDKEEEKEWTDTVRRKARTLAMQNLQRSRLLQLNDSITSKYISQQENIKEKDFLQYISNSKRNYNLDLPIANIVEVLLDDELKKNSQMGQTLSSKHKCQQSRTLPPSNNNKSTSTNMNQSKANLEICPSDYKSEISSSDEEYSENYQKRVILRENSSKVISTQQDNGNDKYFISNKYTKKWNKKQKYQDDSINVARQRQTQIHSLRSNSTYDKIYPARTLPIDLFQESYSNSFTIKKVLMKTQNEIQEELKKVHKNEGSSSSHQLQADNPSPSPHLPPKQETEKYQPRETKKHLISTKRVDIKIEPWHAEYKEQAREEEDEDDLYQRSTIINI